MARNNYEKFTETVGVVGEGAEVKDYLAALQAADLSPRRWIDAKHAGAIDVRRGDDGIVRVYSAALNEGGA